MTKANQIIRQKSRSFSLAASLLPKRYRASVVSLYAWCRAVDDAVDLETDHQTSLRILAEFKQDILLVSRGEDALLPETGWIKGLIVDHRIDPQHAIELIEGMELDANGFSVRTDGDLRRYCYHAAGTVGLMMMQIMGVNDAAACRHAVALGVAMQMTNIARDVREDAMRGRSYLPGVMPRRSNDPSRVKDEVERILEMAERQYAIGWQGIGRLPRGCRAAIRVAAAVYREIGREIQRQGYPVLQRRVVLPRLRLFLVAAAAIVSPLTGAVGKICLPTLSFLSSCPQKFTAMIDSKLNQSPKVSSFTMQSRSSVCLGLSLTAIMATVLFVMVYVNPKDPSYGSMPLVYAAVSLVVAIVMNRLSSRFESQA